MTTTAGPRDFVLPYPPRGMRRPEAAAYVGVSPSLFDQMIHDGVMPKPKRYRRRNIWDRWALDEAFSCLPTDADTPVENPWDRVSNKSLWDTMSSEPRLPHRQRHPKRRG